jgi:hypothetical protein
VFDSSNPRRRKASKLKEFLSLIITLEIGEKEVDDVLLLHSRICQSAHFAEFIECWERIELHLDQKSKEWSHRSLYFQCEKSISDVYELLAHKTDISSKWLSNRFFQTWKRFTRRSLTYSLPAAFEHAISYYKEHLLLQVEAGDLSTLIAEYATDGYTVNQHVDVLIDEKKSPKDYFRWCAAVVVDVKETGVVVRPLVINNGKEIHIQMPSHRLAPAFTFTATEPQEFKPFRFPSAFPWPAREYIRQIPILATDSDELDNVFHHFVCSLVLTVNGLRWRNRHMIGNSECTYVHFHDEDDLLL